MGPRLLVPLLTGADHYKSSSTETLPEGFLEDLVARFSPDPEHLGDLFHPVFDGVCGEIAARGLLSPFAAAIDALIRLSSLPPLRTLLLASPRWRPECSARDVTEQCLLGSLLGVGVDPIQTVALLELLPSRETLYVSQVDAAYYSMRTALHMLHSKIHQLLYALVKGSPHGREAVLDWIAWLANKNADRLKIHVDPATVTPDRAVANLFAVMLRFCEPFLAPRSPKIALIDPNYFVCTGRFDLIDTTKINASTSDYKEYVSQVRARGAAAYAPNFVTECFFLTVQYFRLGVVRMVNEYMDLLRSLRDAQQALDSFEASASRLGSQTTAVNDMAIRNAKAQIQAMKDSKLALDVTLLDPQMMENSFSLITLMVSWMLRLVSRDEEQEQHQDQDQQLEQTGEKEQERKSRPGSLPEQPPKAFVMLPEFFVECVGEYALFISRFAPQFWSNNRPIELLVTFIITFLDRPAYVKNPYIRAKFIDVLFTFADPELEHIFDVYEILVQQMAPKMMRFYVEVESTGASSQFYDKFNIRYSISKIFKTVWEHPSHRAMIIAASRDTELFIRFINLLLNDSTYLLDESITKLAEIHERQIEMGLETWSSRPPREQQEREHGLRTLERQCESYMMLANSTLDMLDYLTSEIVDPFLRSEVVQRLAAMLCFNIVQLVGPKCSSLKVAHPEKYHWEPRQVLRMLVGILLNMSRRDEFLRAVSHDSRSFSRETFAKAASILRKHAIRPDADIVLFEKITARIAELVDSEAQADEEMGEIPEEFLDPLMFTLMEDPVLLTTSNVTVDRSTIVAHLLNDQTDPFNRMPLSMAQVQPNEELKARIGHFKQARK